MCPKWNRFSRPGIVRGFSLAALAWCGLAPPDRSSADALISPCSTILSCDPKPCHRMPRCAGLFIEGGSLPSLPSLGVSSLDLGPLSPYGAAALFVECRPVRRRFVIQGGGPHRIRGRRRKIRTTPRRHGSGCGRLVSSATAISARSRSAPRLSVAAAVGLPLTTSSRVAKAARTLLPT